MADKPKFNISPLPFGFIKDTHLQDVIHGGLSAGMSLHFGSGSSVSGYASGRMAMYAHRYQNPLSKNDSLLNLFCNSEIDIIALKSLCRKRAPILDHWTEYMYECFHDFGYSDLEYVPPLLDHNPIQTESQVFMPFLKLLESLEIPLRTTAWEYNKSYVERRNESYKKINTIVIDSMGFANKPLPNPPVPKPDKNKRSKGKMNNGKSIPSINVGTYSTWSPRRSALCEAIFQCT